MVFTDRNVLVCDKIVKLSIVTNNSALHKDTVLDLCTLAYLNASEQYRVLYPSPILRKSVDSPEHNSRWKHDQPFSGLIRSAYSQEAISLIQDLIAQDEWVEEETCELIEMVKLT